MRNAPGHRQDVAQLGQSHLYEFTDSLRRKEHMLKTTQDPFRDAVRFLRIGNHSRAEEEVRKVLKTRRLSTELEIQVAAIRAEIADHDGNYKAAAGYLEDFEWVTTNLEDQLRKPKAEFIFPGGKNASWRNLRRRLFLQWQRSVAAYRDSRYAESRSLLRTALKIAKQLDPRPEGLLTQLYYGEGKVLFQRGDFAGATRAYRESIVNAAAGPATAISQKVSKEELRDEEAAARYSIAKALALGLGQCLREQGRLEEAYPLVVAGRLLLQSSGDESLMFHAQQTLASIERGTAGER